MSNTASLKYDRDDDAVIVHVHSGGERDQSARVPFAEFASGYSTIAAERNGENTTPAEQPAEGADAGTDQPNTPEVDPTEASPAEGEQADSGTGEVEGTK